MGFVDRFDIITALSGLELSLKKLGGKVRAGASVSAALEVFSNED